MRAFLERQIELCASLCSAVTVSAIHSVQPDFLVPTFQGLSQQNFTNLAVTQKQVSGSERCANNKQKWSSATRKLLNFLGGKKRPFRSVVCNCPLMMAGLLRFWCCMDRFHDRPLVYIYINRWRSQKESAPASATTRRRHTYCSLFHSGLLCHEVHSQPFRSGRHDNSRCLGIPKYRNNWSDFVTPWMTVNK